MPQRARLCISQCDCVCDISGERVLDGVAQYRRKNKGNLYSGNWNHPLSPYKWNPKKPDDPRKPVLAKFESVTYKNWNAVTFSSEKYGYTRSLVVKSYSEKCHLIPELLTDFPRIWLFGYEMSQGQKKIHGWYSNQLPIFDIESEVQDNVVFVVEELLQLAEECLKNCKKQIQTAWFVSPAKSDEKKKKVKLPKGDFSFIELAFWQRTEAQFFKTVKSVI